jgi:hypothetical protein
MKHSSLLISNIERILKHYTSLYVMKPILGTTFSYLFFSISWHDGRINVIIKKGLFVFIFSELFFHL